MDMFLQPTQSWVDNVNFIHPARPTAGRVVTFLPSTGARSVLAIPHALTVGRWWSPWLERSAPAVLDSFVSHGFRVVFLDYSTWSRTCHRGGVEV